MMFSERAISAQSMLIESHVMQIFYSSSIASFGLWVVSDDVLSVRVLRNSYRGASNCVQSLTISLHWSTPHWATVSFSRLSCWLGQRSIWFRQHSLNSLSRDSCTSHKSESDTQLFRCIELRIRALRCSYRHSGSPNLGEWVQERMIMSSMGTNGAQ
jgi:hypothetical protein